MAKKDKHADRLFWIGLIAVIIVGWNFGWVIGIMFSTILGFLYYGFVVKKN